MFIPDFATAVLQKHCFSWIYNPFLLIAEWVLMRMDQAHRRWHFLTPIYLVLTLKEQIMTIMPLHYLHSQLSCLSLTTLVEARFVHIDFDSTFQVLVSAIVGKLIVWT
jgi:hypothetical protein